MQGKRPRVLHVSFLPSLTMGIVRQLDLETQAAKALQIPWDTVMFGPHKPLSDTIITPNLAPSKIRESSRSSLMGRITNNLLLRKEFYPWVSQLGADYDIILLRYLVHDYWLTRFLRDSGAMVGTVHHACETQELARGDGMVGQLRASAESRLGPRALTNSDVIVSVTREIADHQLSRVQDFRGLSVVYPNGCSAIVSPVDDRRESTPELLFMASYFAPWQGLDLLLDSTQASQQDFRLHIVGNLSETDTVRALNDCRITLHGQMDLDSIRILASQCWLGVSSLAPSRQGLNWACPIKARDYLEMGLPVAGNYEEELPSTFPFYVRVAPHVDDLIQAARQWRAVPRDVIANQAVRNASKETLLRNLYSELTHAWQRRLTIIDKGL